MRVAKATRPQLPAVDLSPHPDNAPGLCLMHFPFRKRFIDDVKLIPGCRYAPEFGKGTWIAPLNAVDSIASIASRHHLQVDSLRIESDPQSKHRTKLKRFKKAFPIQIKAAQPALHDPSFLYAWEMGTGKTLAALMLMKSIGGTCLIVCPAIARTVWQDELDKWWPKHPDAFAVTTGQEAKDLWYEDVYPQIAITSYALLHHVDVEGLDLIIFDESHHLSESKSRRHKAARKLRSNNPNAHCLLLSGTPLTNEPKNLHAQLDLMHPDAWGSWWKFCKRYCKSVPNQFASGGFSFKGLNPDNALELRQRLGVVSTRLVKADVASHLPPINVRTIKIDGPTMAERFRLQDFDASLGVTKQIRIDHACQWVEDTRASLPFALVFTHLTDTAERIAKEIAKRDRVLLLTGKHVASPEKRYSLLTEFQKEATGTVVATMHSVGEAINNLTFVSQALFAELYYRPSTITQAIARIHRMTTVDPVTIWFLIVRRSIDETILANLRPKVEAIGELIKHGSAGTKLEQALSGSDDDDAAFTEHIESITATHDPDDDYA